MFGTGLPEDTDVIVLSDSDEPVVDNGCACGVTVTISDERPLDPALFMEPSTSTGGYDNELDDSKNSSSDSTISAEEKVISGDEDVLQKANNGNKLCSDFSDSRQPLQSSSCHSTQSVQLSQFDLTAYCYESYDPRAPAFVATKLSNKFECTFGGCKRLLSNNVSLMFHLWSHVVSFRSFGVESPVADLEKLCTCPQCLNVFPSQNRLHQHFVRAHWPSVSPSTCLICEIMVEKEHHLAHDDFDAPYHCRTCRFRTSIRTHFLDHFVKFHSYTSTLLCPFCLSIFNAPRARKNRPLMDRQYTDHFLSHAKGKYFRCERCALKFLNKNEKISHLKDHSKRSPRWECKAYAERSRRKGIRLCPLKSTPHCFECYEDVGNPVEHCRRTYTCKSCCYTTYCHNAFNHHERIGCTVRRLGLTKKRAMKVLVMPSNVIGKTNYEELLSLYMPPYVGEMPHVQSDSITEVNDDSLEKEIEEAELFGIKKRKTLETSDSAAFPIGTNAGMSSGSEVTRISSLAFAKRQFIEAVAEDDHQVFPDFLQLDGSVF